jgi:hypothetical protein
MLSPLPPRGRGRRSRVRALGSTLSLQTLHPHPLPLAREIGPRLPRSPPIPHIARSESRLSPPWSFPLSISTPAGSLDDESDRPMRDDIRLLGRLLGDTVREQRGDAAFELVERVRQASVAFRRDDDVAARRELEQLLDGITREQTMIVVRAFSYFSHLANLAEDVHTGRTRRHAEITGEAAGDGTFARALDRIAAAGLGTEALHAFFRDAEVVPVLTAHPTEVQRKSVRDLEMELDRLLNARDRLRLTPDERASNDESVRRAVLALWQTRMLRLEKLDVLDEVLNGLSYFEHTFLPELPRLYGALEDELARRLPPTSPASAGEVDRRSGEGFGIRPSPQPSPARAGEGAGIFRPSPQPSPARA